MRTTHTFAELEVSNAAYLEIWELLAKAGYHHTFIDGAIDMSGIALTRKRKDRKIEVFLGGTCNGSPWRGQFAPMLDRWVDYFDPVLVDWNEEAQKREIEKRQTCDFVLYVITPRMAGVYAIAEVVDDSNKRPEKTLFCYLAADGEAAFDAGQIKSLTAVAKMIERNGASVFTDLAEVAGFLNGQVPQAQD